MNEIEVKATFKNINIKDKTVLQFELSPFYLAELPDMTKLANTDVMLTISSEQPELPLEEEEPEFEQEAIPVYDPEDEVPQLPEGEYEEVIEEADDMDEGEQEW